MTALRKLLVLAILPLASNHALAQTMLELLPQDGAFSIALRDREAYAGKAVQLGDDTGWQDATNLCDLLAAFYKPLKLEKGVRSNACWAAIYMPAETPDDWHPGRHDLLVQLIPFSKPNAMAANFGIPRGSLAANKLVETKAEDGIARYATRFGTHIAVAPREKTLARFLKSKPLAESLAAPQRKRLNEADLVCHIGPSMLAEVHKDLERELIARLRGSGDPAEKKFVDQLVRGMKEAQSVVAGVRLDDGLDAHVLITARRESEAARTLASLRGQGKSSTLAGLPDGDVLFAHAYAGDRVQHAWLAQAFFRHFLEDPMVTDRLVAGASVTSALGLMHEIWGRVHGNRFAVYQSAAPERTGKLSAIAILDCDNPSALLAEMRTLAQMASADTLDGPRKKAKEEIDIARLVRELGHSSFSVRQSAATRLALIGEPALPFLEKALESKKLDLETVRRAQELDKGIRDRTAWRRKGKLLEENHALFQQATLTFVPGAETRVGRRIDVIQIKHAAAEPAALERFGELLGPDWDKIRVAVAGKQIVVMLGSDVARFDAALRNLQQGHPGLAASMHLRPFYDRCAKDRLFEFHVGFESKSRLLAANNDAAASGQLTSLSISLSDASVQFDVRMPAAELRASLKADLK